MELYTSVNFIIPTYSAYELSWIFESVLEPDVIEVKDDDSVLFVKTSESQKSTITEKLLSSDSGMLVFDGPIQAGMYSGDILGFLVIISYQKNTYKSEYYAVRSFERGVLIDEYTGSSIPDIVSYYRDNHNIHIYT